MEKDMTFATLAERVGKLARVIVFVAALGCGAATSEAGPGDSSLGMAVMSARVNFDGTLIDGAGATSAVATSPGIYEVVFERDVSGCTYSVTLRDFALAWANASSATERAVAVRIAKHDLTTYMSVGFHLIVYCAR
jgi:hypothetical protein